MVDSESLHRTVKLDMDSGRASSYAEAEALAHEYVLQVVAGPEIGSSESLQTALLTAVVVSVGRAFLGGVAVVTPDAILRAPLYRGRSLREVVLELGATLATDVDAELDTLCMGTLDDLPVAVGRRLHVSVDHWDALIAPRPLRWGEFASPLAGILAAALGVSELFQARRGDAWAAQRRLRVSLWSPGEDSAVAGPVAYALPKALWLVGLGHLGQAYAWVLALMPYREPSEVEVTLQDFDEVSLANVSTGLFSTPGAVGRRKTRVVGETLERAGFRTRLIERAFDRETHPRPSEASWVLGGLDKVEPRRALAEAGFRRYVDAGIGDDGDTYLDIVLQTFPSEESAEEAFPPGQLRIVRELAPAYEALVSDRVEAGAGLGDAECGVVTIAGEAVGAAFVGTVAATFVVADLLRHLNGGSSELATLSIDLRHPADLSTGRTSIGRPPSNPGFVWVDPPSSASG